MSNETKAATRSDDEPALKSHNSAQDVSGLIQSTVGEFERMLDASHVIGEPLQFGGTTIVPLVSIGFGFGAGGGGGGGRDSKGDLGEGGGGGGGGGGGVKPLAVLIIENGSARLEPIPEPASGFAKLSTAIADALERRAQKNEDDD